LKDDAIAELSDKLRQQECRILRGNNRCDVGNRTSGWFFKIKREKNGGSPSYV